MQPARRHQLPRDRLKGYKARPLPTHRSRALTMDIMPMGTSSKRQVVSNYKPAASNEVAKKVALPSGVVTSKKKISKRIYNKRTIATSMAIVLTIVALYANINLITANTNLETTAIAETTNSTSVDAQTTNSVRDVDETEPEPSKIREYKVSADLPRFLKIDTLKINSRVMRVGVDANNEILTPKNVFNVGWYEGSSKPGEPGAIFINGHVSGPSKKGIFYNLKKLNEGDIIKIETGDSDLIEYKVVATETVAADQVDMNKVLRSYDVDKQGLNLMTCSGEFIKDADTFDKRQIVYSVRI